jgi:hypothetical protein
VEQVFPLNETERQLIRGNFDYLETILNVRFVENGTGYQAPFFSFSQKSEYKKFGTELGFTNFIPNYFCLPVEMTTKEIGFNINHLADDRFPIEKNQTILHETLHWALTFTHPFERGYARTQPDKLATGFSIMNYAHEIDRDGYSQIIPVGLMPADLEAADYFIGVNENINQGDTVHELKNYAPDTDSSFHTIKMLVDRGGVDTLSAREIKNDVVINLLRGSSARSEVRVDKQKSYVTLSHDTDIENVICGDAKTSVTLNELNNIVYAPLGVVSSLVIDPLHCGHDVFVGSYDRIVLTKDYAAAESEWKTSSVGPSKVSIAGEEISFPFGTKIEFDANNDIVLANQKLEDFNPEKIIIKEKDSESIPDKTTASLWEVFSDTPDQLFFSFKDAFYQGALLTFLTSLTTEGLQRKGCTRNQIAAVNQAVKCLVTLYNGAYIASAAGCLTNVLLHSFGFSEQTCNLASTVASSTVNAAHHFSPLGLAKMAMGTAGSYAGGRFTLWSKNKITKLVTQYCVEPESSRFDRP